MKRTLVNMIALVLFCAVFVHSITATPIKSCKGDDEFYPYFSTRTAYEYVRGHISRPETSKTCKPVQVWMLSRHGTRYPGVNSMPKLLKVTKIRHQIIENHERGDGSLCPDLLAKLRNWQATPDFKIESAAQLSSQGENDLNHLAKRLQNAFPELLRKDLAYVRNEDYHLRSTNRTRAEDSMRHFSYGLFGTTRAAIPFAKPPVNDTLLLAHKNCPLWIAGNDVDPVITERDKFTDGPKVQSLIRNLSSRLGFSTLLKFKKIESMYNMCRFETALYLNRTSTWCLLFKKNELEILEYREDLRQYYYSGPGREMNVKLGCQTLRDMFKHFKDVTTNRLITKPRGVFYFAHTVTLQALMSTLGVNKEAKPLLADDYATSHHRNYRTSLLGPFAANVIAVLYRCDESVKTSFKVSFHVNEKLIEVPGCSNGICDWDYLENKYSRDLKYCTMDFCYK